LSDPRQIAKLPGKLSYLIGLGDLRPTRDLATSFEFSRIVCAMYLKRLYIRGFRSISELDLQFTPGKNVIIGRNNAGKSNIVHALNIVLGETAPAWERSENVTDADFYSFRSSHGDGKVVEETENTIFIWCELERRVGEDLDWSEIDKCFGYNFYGTRPQRYGVGVPTRIELDDLGGDFPKIFELNDEELEYDAKVWVDAKLKNQNTFKQHLSDKYQFAYAFLAQKTEKGILKRLRFLYRESEQKNWILAFRASVRTELLQSAILPSFRDPALQLRIAPWNWFGKLMRYLLKDSGDDTDLKEALGQVRSVGDRVFAQVTSKIENDALSVSFPDAKLSFQFNQDTKGDLYKDCVIYVDDGFKSLLTDKGAGIQSATIFGLFCYFTKHVNTTGSALLCVEEPELYLHPHARRVISDRLDDFLDGGRNQVIVTTHGVEFLRTANDTFNILLVKKSKDRGTTAQALDAREFLTLLINNNQNELFFADKVILCEGFDEHILRAAAEELFPGELDRRNVSIVSVEGKDRLIKMARLILKLGMECFVLADFDFLLRDTTKPKGYETKEHPSVEHLPLEFFAQRHIAGKDAGKYQGRVVQLRNKLRKEKPKCFYQATHVSEFEIGKLPSILQDLRSRGIGILEGEIEHLSKDETWLKAGTKKLSLERVYELRERLNSGKTMAEMFDLISLSEFLAPILEKRLL
jgi:putative ATP-dependent endonuclease of the OLD family